MNRKDAKKILDRAERIWGNEDNFRPLRNGKVLWVSGQAGSNVVSYTELLRCCREVDREERETRAAVKLAQQTMDELAETL